MTTIRFPSGKNNEGNTEKIRLALSGLEDTKSELASVLADYEDQSGSTPNVQTQDLIAGVLESLDDAIDSLNDILM